MTQHRRITRAELARLCGMRRCEVRYALHKRRKGLGSSLVRKLRDKMLELGIKAREIGPR